jgi:hypothetical protein
MLFTALLCLSTRGAALAQGPPRLSGGQPPANTWVAATIDFDAALKKSHPDGRWVQADGYSDNLFRAQGGEVLIRTGIQSKAAGFSPGFYTNATVAWNPRGDTARVVEVANWGGGSYGHGKLLPAFKDHPTPTPRHTYDSIAYVPDDDAIYMILGANWRVGGTGADEEAKTQLKIDGGLTWRYSFATGRWTPIKSHVNEFFQCSPYEAHMEYWPEGQRLIFLDDNGGHYAEFDLTARKWEAKDLAGECPMRLYNARSAWDARRSLWVFRLGPKLCTFDPRTRTFTPLPPCWEHLPPMPAKGEDRKTDPRWSWKGVVYVPKHDAYLACGPTGDDTRVFDVAKGVWHDVKGGALELPNGYLQYDPESDQVLLNYQLRCFKLRYVP